ncbi:hypothetical protein [Synechocystis sp. PCC 7338]|uniref:hypothetical protein n=1 Tax=Synechocystis sp. PCC 7338 TaxID=2732530 RepID=UPI001BAE98C9|nr:hypothetical protein [Synechocystis sp. PCC 7338]QUS60148.1 hypothetical protein HTZ78_05330 [Synechocystis sp. PCC 7338]
MKDGMAKLAKIPTTTATVPISINVQPDNKPLDRENNLKKMGNLLCQTIGQNLRQDC